MSASGVGPEEIRNEHPGRYKEQAASGLVERFLLESPPRGLVVSVYVFGKIFLSSGIAIIAAIEELLGGALERSR